MILSKDGKPVSVAHSKQPPNREFGHPPPNSLGRKMKNSAPRIHRPAQR